MGDNSNQKTESEYRLKFSDILSGIIPLLPRIPSIIFYIKKIFSIKSNNTISLGSIIEQNAVKYNHKTALLFENQKLTHKEFNETINQYANYFLSIGIQKNQPVIVYLENRPELLFMIAAMAKIGAVASLINPNQRSRPLLHSIEVDKGNYYVIGEELVEYFEEVYPNLNLSDEKLFWMKDSGQTECPSNYINLKEVVKNFSKENPETTKTITAGQRYANVFTSGTTGLPKASIQTHKKWLLTYYWFGKINLNFNSNDVIYVPIPFFHTNALIVAWPSAAAAGAAIAIRRKFSASNFWQDIAKYNASSFIYIGEVCRYLFNSPPTDLDKNHHIKKIFGNGLRPDIWKLFKKRFNISKVIEFYGAADGNVSFTNTLNIDSCVGWTTVNYAIVKYDIENNEPYKNKDGFFEKVEVGKTGLLISEINDKLPFDGYVNKENNNEKIFHNAFIPGDQWFNSGDLMRDIGFKHAQFVDRLGDTFRWKGENVSTAEVEEIANTLKSITGSTVYGVQIPNSDGRAGMMAITSNLTPDSFDFGALSSILIKELPSYAVPIFVRFCKKFETTATHKIKKFHLKNDGINTQDPIFVMLPKSNKYVPMTEKILEDITNGNYLF
ncbi:long-chain-acyl-CoA synthetase [Lutibacter sp. B1]|uniref:long-chain-acyl-CoA synthetase n=1 Tax=Lutibacter sp. B1 TaxID=2725996 RepID=UPI00145728DC|nr:long-chain-acyl-CoA synthetase [Lutibacter sp. B1]NLP56908.1 long-chain-acyl-CoA synthetase [Lutibacter sp. B1]